jgi:hypothetical protein
MKICNNNTGPGVLKTLSAVLAITALLVGGAPQIAAGGCMEDCLDGGWRGSNCSWQDYECYSVENLDRCEWQGNVQQFYCVYKDANGNIVLVGPVYSDTCYTTDGC